MSELHPSLAPLAFLLGSWTGVGVGGYPDIESFRYGEELRVTHDGRPFLFHSSRTWIVDDSGARVRPSHAEDGYWRPGSDGAIEFVVAHATGFVEVWVGEVRGPTVTLATDVVVRTATAKEVAGGQRSYGLVEGALLSTFDMAAVGQPLQSHLSARLLPAS